MRQRVKSCILICTTLLVLIFIIIMFNRKEMVINRYENYINETIDEHLKSMKSNIKDCSDITTSMMSDKIVHRDDLKVLYSSLVSIVESYQELETIIISLELENDKWEDHLVAHDLSLQIENILRKNRVHEVINLEENYLELIEITYYLTDEYKQVFNKYYNESKQYGHLENKIWIKLLKELNMLELKNEYRMFEKH